MLALYVLAACVSVVVAVPTPMNYGGHGSDCKSNYFWFAPKSICLFTGTKDQCDPPAQHSCGHNNWYWHKSLNYCVPSSPDYGDAGCDAGWNWDDSKYCCVPMSSHGHTSGSGHFPDSGDIPFPDHIPVPGHTSGHDSGECDSSFFFWPLKSTCLPYGGDSGHSTPPNGYQCPDQWYWHSDGYCAPSNPDYDSETPSCGNSYGWDKSDLCCKRY